MNKKEYDELLKEYYTENNKNIENWIFIASTGAVTLLAGYSEKIYSEYMWLFIIAVSLFIITIILQLISARISKKGCDYGLDENGKFDVESIKCFNLSEKLNTIFFWVFVIAMVLSTFVILINNYNSEIIHKHIKSEKIFEQTIKAKDFEYYIKKVGNNE